MELSALFSGFSDWPTGRQERLSSGLATELFFLMDVSSKDRRERRRMV
jgi:hypothetical protein